MINSDHGSASTPPQFHYLSLFANAAFSPGDFTLGELRNSHPTKLTFYIFKEQILEMLPM